MMHLFTHYTVICIIFLSFLYNHVYAETIRMGFFQHPPHQYKNKEGKIVGATIEYFNKVAPKMGYNVEWVGPLPLNRMIMYLKQGKLDGTAHFIKTKSFEKYVSYADKHFHLAHPVFVVKKKNKLNQINSGYNIKGYKVLYLTKHPPSKFVQDNISNLKMNLITPYDLMWQKALRLLMRGTIDAVHDLNEFSVPFVAKMTNISQHIKTLRLPEPAEPVYVAFPKNFLKGKLLLKKYNKIQAKMNFGHKDYKKLIQKQ